MPAIPDGRRVLDTVETVALGALVAFAAVSLVTGRPSTAAFVVATVMSFLVPGYLVLSRFGAIRLDVCEWVAGSFAVGYVLLAILTVVTTEVGLNARTDAWIVIALSAGLLLLPRRSGPPGFLPALAEDVCSGRRPEPLLRLATLVVAVGVAAAFARLSTWSGNWEDLIIARKLFENGAIHVDSVMHRAGVAPTYLYSPLLLIESIIGHLAGVDVVLVPLRLQWFMTLLAILAVYVLARAVFPCGVVAPIAALACAGLVVIDPSAFSDNIGVFDPYPNRYGFSPGILLPLLFAVAVRAVYPTVSRRFAGFAVALAASASLVHPKEVIQFLLWTLVLGVACVVAGRERRRAATTLALVLVSTAALLLVYQVRHKAVVAHAYVVIGTLRKALRGQLAGFIHHPLDALVGRLPATIDTPVGAYAFAHYRGLFESYDWWLGVRAFVVLALAAAPLLFVFTRSFGTTLIAASLVLPLIALRVPLVFVGLSWAAGTPDVGHLLAPFALWAILALALGIHALALGLQSLAARAGRTASALGFPRWEAFWIVAAAAVLAFYVTSALWRVVGMGAAYLGRGAAPEVPFAWAVLAALVAMGARLLLARRGIQLGFPGTVEVRRVWVVLVALGVVIGSTTLVEARRGRSLVAEVTASSPAQRSWDLARRYPDLRLVNNDLPWAMVDFIRRTVPPLRTFAYDPKFILAIPVYLNQYVLHPGAKLSTDLEYFGRYVRGDRHPIFNFDSFEDSAAETLRVIEEFGVDYILVNPRYHDHLGAMFARFNQLGPVFDRLYDRDGFSLFRVNRTVLTAVQGRLSQPAQPPSGS